MRRDILRAALAVAVLSLALTGCTPSYVITQGLDESFSSPSTFRMGTFEDNLPSDTALDDRPTAEDIALFRTYLQTEVAKDYDLGLQMEEGDDCVYELRGSILDYKRGSGFLRFFVGFGAGSAKVVTELTLVDLRDGHTVFAGNFEGQVQRWSESGDQMFKRVAKDFRKALKKGGGVREQPVVAEDRGGL
ncbi:MAG: DUF4410 domain-containing protein [Candidatus Krumholzibacteriia bacterium]